MAPVMPGDEHRRACRWWSRRRRTRGRRSRRCRLPCRRRCRRTMPGTTRRCRPADARRITGSFQIGAKRHRRAPICIGGDARKCGEARGGMPAGIPDSRIKSWFCAMRRARWHGSCNATCEVEVVPRREARCRARLRHQRSASSISHSGDPTCNAETFIRTTLAAALAAAGLTMGMAAQAADTIKVGVLHSLSGTMAISETVAEGRRADDDRGDQRQGRRAWARSSSRSSSIPASNWPLFAEKARQLHHAGQGRRGVRLLDVGVAQVGAAGVRGAERPAVLPGAVRGRGAVEERVLHRRRAEPAGDPGGRVPDEQGRRRRQALGAARHRLRLSAHDQQDPARVPASRRASTTRTSTRSTRRSATATTRRSSPTSRSSRPAARRPWSRRSTATRTCRSTRSSATRA